MLKSEEATVIDWMTATSGSPAADIARTMLLLKDSALPPKMTLPIKLIITFIRKRIYSSYLKRYLELSNITMTEIKQWEIPIAAARLTEWIPKREKDHLIEIIDIGIK